MSPHNALHITPPTRRSPDLAGLVATLPHGTFADSIPQDITLAGLSLDSRKIRPGFLFAALKGEKTDGRNFIPQALDSGAACLLLGEKDKAPDGIPVLRAANPRRAFALLTAAFYRDQPDTITAVTGTNGKTSTVQFCRQLWEHLGEKPAALGTLGIDAPALGISAEDGGITTPDPETLHETLAALAEKHCTHLAMEASSHGLAQYRLDGVRVRAAGFTNLSRDHLDYHKTEENYLAAKLRLFTDLLPQGGTAVLNGDDAVCAQVAAACSEKQILTYSLKDKNAALAVLARNPEPDGQRITLRAFGKNYDLFFPLVGAFQLYNALCALGLVLAEIGRKPEDVVPLLEKLAPVRGRMEYIGAPKDKKSAIYVDYAHTPDALENVLNALRPHTSGRLHVLIGCGGDRDSGKRPVMGEAAARLADHVIVTDDNPRSEDPDAIRAAVMQGCPAAENIAGRREAIFKAVAALRDGDILAVTGKGHEQGQTIGDTVLPFDDARVVREALDAAQSGDV